MGRRSNWHHDEDSICNSGVSIYERCLDVNPCRKQKGAIDVNRFSWSKNANYGRSNAKFSKENANSNDGFRPIVRDGQDIIMKPSLYEKMCLMKNFRNAYKKARKGKGSKWYVKEFNKDLEKNLLQLQKELLNMTYEPKPLKQFTIKDPKTRVISASNFRDRVVHHALCNMIEPIFEKAFIWDSYANRKGKGTHAALKRFDLFKRKISRNGKQLPDADDKNHVYGYVLKADVRHYFDSVDHEIMIHVINRRIKDERILWLIRKILDNHNCKIHGKGMPIGNLTSQFFANVYLNELDYFVKHKLRAKYYIRYVDDFVILSRSKTQLESYKSEINEFLKSIKLELHPQKSNIIPLRSGVNFLGFRVFYKHRLLKKSNIRQIKQRLEYFQQLYKDGVLEKSDILTSLEGWNAYAIHANTYKLRKQMTRKLKEKLNIE
ncbi:MAG: reverse transcriptase domain-containing protein [Candidatus Aenigmatarchaeota archaeon]